MTDPQPAAVRRPRLDVHARRELVLFLGLLFLYGFFQQVPAWNEYSRYDLVRALVEDGTTRIDRFHDNTGDTAYFEGHYYSDKPPGTALMGVPVYLLQRFTFAIAGGGTPDPPTAVEALSFVESGVLTALLVVLLLRFLRPHVGEAWALVVSLGYGLGSIALPFATMFFGHSAATFLLFGAFYELWRWRSDPQKWRPMVAGLLAGCAVLTDFPALLGVAVLALYAAWLGRGPALRYVLGGLPLVLVLGWYDWVTFGDPVTIGYQYSTTFGGHLLVRLPSWQTLLDLLAGPRGLVRLALWFLFAPLGLTAVRRLALRAEVVLCAVICAVFLVFNSAVDIPFGGWVPGPRYLLEALPFATVLVALAPSVVRPFVLSFMALAMAVFFVATVTMPNAPELYRDPLFELWLPRLLSHDIATTIAWLRWGLHGIQPLIVLVVTLTAAAAALLATFRSASTARRLSGFTAGALVLLIVAFAFPFWPPSAFALGAPTDRLLGSIAIVEVGVTPVRTGNVADTTIWAQVENRGPSLDHTRVVFTVFGDGKPAWSAWHADVSWAGGERKRLAVDWAIGDVAPGDYGVDVSVVSGDLQLVYATVHDASVVRVRR